jgi:hypothetical protein
VSEDNEAVDGHPWEQVGCGMAFKLINILYTECSECKWQNMDRTCGNDSLMQMTGLSFGP